MSTTTTTTRDRGDRYGPIEWAQLAATSRGGPFAVASSGVVAARQTASGTVAVVGAVVTFARSTARVAVEAAFTLVTLAPVRVRHTRALTRAQVAERVARTQVVALAHCTHTHTHSPIITAEAFEAVDWLASRSSPTNMAASRPAE